MTPVPALLPLVLRLQALLLQAGPVVLLKRPQLVFALELRFRSPEPTDRTRGGNGSVNSPTKDGAWAHPVHGEMSRLEETAHRKEERGSGR